MIPAFLNETPHAVGKIFPFNASRPRTAPLREYQQSLLAAQQISAFCQSLLHVVAWSAALHGDALRQIAQQRQNGISEIAAFRQIPGKPPVVMQVCP